MFNKQMKVMKRFPLRFVVLITVFWGLSIISLSQTPVTIDGITYEIDINNEASVFEVNLTGTVTFPAQIEYEGRKYDVTSICGNGFINNEGITKIILPKTIKRILGHMSFINCPNIEEFVIEDGDTDLEIMPSICNTKKLYIGRNVVSNGAVDSEKYSGAFGTKLTNISFSPNITVIPGYLFLGCTEIEELSLPDNLIIIGECAFGGCKKLKDLILPDKLRIIGGNAFAGCNSITSVSIPSSVEELGSNIFTNDINLTDVCIEDGSSLLKKWRNEPYTFPVFNGLNLKSLYIGRDIDSNCFFVNCSIEKLLVSKMVNKLDPIFKNCQYISNITIEDSNKPLVISSQFIPDRGLSTLYLGRDINAMYNSSVFGVDIKELEIGPNVIEIYGGLFKDCIELNEVIIPEGVRIIGDKSFYGCSSLEQITLASSITKMGSECFDGCERLKKIISYIVNPSYHYNYLSSNFTNYTYENVPIYIPVNSTPYYDASNWDFKNIYEMESTDIIINVSIADEPLKYYSINGQQLASPSKGINIIKMSDGTSKKIIVK